MNVAAISLGGFVRLLGAVAMLTVAVLHVWLWLSLRRREGRHWIVATSMLALLDAAAFGWEMLPGPLTTPMLGLLNAVGSQFFLAAMWIGVADLAGLRVRTQRIAAVYLAVTVPGVVVWITWHASAAGPDAPVNLWRMVGHPALIVLLSASLIVLAVVACVALRRAPSSPGRWMVAIALVFAVIRPLILSRLTDLDLTGNVTVELAVIMIAVIADAALFGLGTVLLVLERERAIAVETATRVERAARMERLGMMAGSIAHDMNNVLSAISTGLELASDPAARPEEVKRDLAEVGNALEHGRGMARRLLMFAKGAPRESPPVELCSWFRDETSALQFAVGAPHTVEVVACDDSLKVRVDAGRLRQLTVNAVLNSRDAGLTAGPVRIRITVERQRLTRERALGVSLLRPGSWAVVRIIDDGPGFPPDAIDKVFEPFFTTKGEAGTGLGLATVFAVVRDVGGAVRALNGEDGGAVVESWFPLVE